MKLGPTRPSASPTRGFTIVELLVVVVIMGVLAALAIYSVRGYILSSKTAEAREIIGSIKAGEEAYYDEVFHYLDATGGLANLHPISSTDGTIKADWRNTTCTGCLDNFRTLGVEVPAPVVFRYSTTAGATGLKSVTLTDVSSQPFANAPDAAYYVVKAISDLKPGGAKTVYYSSNFSAEIYGENAGQ